MTVDMPGFVSGSRRISVLPTEDAHDIMINSDYWWAHWIRIGKKKKDIHWQDTSWRLATAMFYECTPR